MNCFNPALGPAFVQWVAISIVALSSFYVPPASSKYSSPHWDISNNRDVLRDLIWAGDRTELATEYLKSSRPSDLVTPFQVLEIVSSGLVENPLSGIITKDPGCFWALGTWCRWGRGMERRDCNEKRLGVLWAGWQTRVSRVVLVQNSFWNSLSVLLIFRFPSL